MPRSTFNPIIATWPVFVITQTQSKLTKLTRGGKGTCLKPRLSVFPATHCLHAYHAGLKHCLTAPHTSPMRLVSGHSALSRFTTSERCYSGSISVFSDPRMVMFIWSQSPNYFRSREICYERKIPPFEVQSIRKRCPVSNGVTPHHKPEKTNPGRQEVLRVIKSEALGASGLHAEARQ